MTQCAHRAVLYLSLSCAGSWRTIAQSSLPLRHPRMSKPVYERTGKLHKLGYVNKSSAHNNDQHAHSLAPSARRGGARQTGFKSEGISSCPVEGPAPVRVFISFSLNAFLRCASCCSCSSACSSWKERTFALSVAKQQVLYFKSDEDFKAHSSTGTANQAGIISLKNSILYLADYMDKRFCIELAARDPQNVTTRHYFIYAESGTELREWMLSLVEGGAVAAGPVAPMRVVPDSFKPSSEAASAAASVSSMDSLPKSYSSLAEDPALIPPLPFPVVLAKFGFLQKKGVYNTSYKTRFCRIESQCQNKKN